MYTLAMAAKKKRGSSEAGQGTTEASTVMASFRRLTGQAALVPFTFMVPLDAPCCCDFFPGGCVGGASYCRIGDLEGGVARHVVPWSAQV